MKTFQFILKDKSFLDGWEYQFILKDRKFVRIFQK